MCTDQGFLGYNDEADSDPRRRGCDRLHELHCGRVRLPEPSRGLWIMAPATRLGRATVQALTFEPDRSSGAGRLSQARIRED